MQPSRSPLEGSLPLVLLASTVTALIATSVIACSKPTPAPAPRLEWTKAQPSSPQVAPTVPQPAATGATCSVDLGRSASVVSSPPDPEAMALFLEGLAKPAVPIGEGEKPPRVTEAALNNTALGAAFGMKPASEILSVRLREGERGTRPVTIPVGACAAFIAQGGLGVVEADMVLTIPGSQDLRIVAHDRDVGPIAVVGGRGDCIGSTTGAPIPAELHVIMRSGEGVVLVRSYVR